jgi:hypothetical protein
VRPTIGAVQTQVSPTGTSGVARAAICLFVGLSCLYLLVARGRITSIDEWHVYATAESLADRGDWIMQVKDIDRTYSRYSVVPSILGAPFCLMSRPVADRWGIPDEDSDRGGGANLTPRHIRMAAVTLQSPLVTAGTAALLFVALCRLGIRGGPALASALGFGVCTLALPYSGSLYVQPTATFALTCLICSAALGRGIATAASLALLLSIRFELIALVPLLSLHALKFRRPAAGHLTWLAAGACIGLALHITVNCLRRDHWLTGDYGGETFSTPAGIGLWSLLFSCGKGLAWFSPIAFAGLCLCPRFVRLAPDIGFLATGTAVTMLVIVSCWWTWHGAMAWGPRLLVPLMPVLILPLAWTFESWEQQPIGLRWILLLTMLASVAVQLRGTILDSVGDRDTGSMLATGNEGIYIPQVGPWGVEQSPDFDTLLSRVWRHIPAARSTVLVCTVVLLLGAVSFVTFAVRSVGLGWLDLRAVVPQPSPRVLFATAGCAVAFMMPSLAERLLLAQSSSKSSTSWESLPEQFQEFRTPPGTGTATGQLYAPLRGNYSFFQLGPTPTQFYIDGVPIFTHRSGIVDVGTAKIETTGLHRLDAESDATGRLNTLYWTTPGSAFYKQLVPRLYLTAPTMSWQQHAAILVAHWKWALWVIAIAFCLFVTVTPQQAGGGRGRGGGER